MSSKIIPVSFMTKNFGNLALLNFQNGKLNQISVQNEVLENDLKTYKIFKFQGKDFLIVTNSSKKVKFIPFQEEGNTYSSETLKRVKDFLNIGQDLLLVDRNGEFYKINEDQQNLKFDYITQNLAIPTYIGKIFNKFVVLGDNYHKIKIFNINDLYDLQTVWVPFMANLIEMVEFNQQALMSFKFVEYGAKSQEEQKIDEEEDQMEMDEENFQKKKKNQVVSKIYYQFYLVNEDQFLNTDYTGKKIFQLENCVKAKVLKFEQQFIVVYLTQQQFSEEDNKNQQQQLHVELRDLQGNIIKNFLNNKEIDIKKNEQKIKVFKTSETSFGIYLYCKASQIEKKSLVLKVEQPQDDIQFNQEDRLLQFQI